jgi:hypothetical protein
MQFKFVDMEMGMPVEESQHVVLGDCRMVSYDPNGNRDKNGDGTLWNFIFVRIQKVFSRIKTKSWSEPALSSLSMNLMSMTMVRFQWPVIVIVSP